MKASSSSFMRRAKAVAFASFTLGFVGMGAWSCVGEGELETAVCADKTIFIQNVSPYLERRCGMLDCHGQPKRNLRIYGQLGLRHPFDYDPNMPGSGLLVPVSNIPGGAGTTDREKDLNFAAVCNLEPELMEDAVKTLGASAEKLLLVTKARGAERHKGGKVVNENDEGDKCILDWLKFRDAVTVGNSCTAAVERLK